MIELGKERKQARFQVPFPTSHNLEEPTAAGKCQLCDGEVTHMLAVVKN